MMARKTLVAAAVAAAAAAAAWRAAMLWNEGREIPVLMYHNVLPDDGTLTVWQVSEDEFARQMRELDHGGYTPILPDDIYWAARGLRLLPRKPVAITFDDGYEGVMKYAEPILAEHGFRAICYVIVGRLGGEGADRGVFDSGPLLSTNEVSAMARRGTIAIGSHSMTHVPAWRQLAMEIPESRYALRRLTGVKTKSYCYPHGLCGYDDMNAALRHGKFRTALACGDAMFHFSRGADLYAIPRVSVYGGRHEFEIRDFGAGEGRAAATVRNVGAPMPVRCMLVERRTGRVHISDGAAVRIGQGRRNTVPEATFEWTGLPKGLGTGDFEAVVCEQNGLFTY